MSPGADSGSPWETTTSSTAVPVGLCRLTAVLRPPVVPLCSERLATGRPSTSTSLYTSCAVGAPEPITTAVPAPYMSTGAAASAAIEYSSRSPETTILVSVAPSSSSSSRAPVAMTSRSPESIRIERSLGPATSMALRMPWVMS